jgi:ribonucleoside-diphosphate reductase alpha chain
MTMPPSTETAKPFRRRFGAERDGTTRHFTIRAFDEQSNAVIEHDGYVTVNSYVDGSPGELFIRMAKQGGQLSGLMEAIGILASLGLQYGVPLEVMCAKMTNMRFDPSGTTGDAELPFASSPLDYVFAWLKRKYLRSEAQE